MSLMAAIDTAVRLQLARDKHGVTYSLSSQVGKDLGFDSVELGSFLEAVAQRLRLDTPSLVYDWNSSRLDECLNSTVAVLVGRIAADTGPAVGTAK